MTHAAHDPTTREPLTGTFASSHTAYVSARFPATNTPNAKSSAQRSPNVSASARSPAAPPPGTIAMSVVDFARTSAIMGFEATASRVWGVIDGVAPTSGLVPTIIFAGMNVTQTTPGCEPAHARQRVQATHRHQHREKRTCRSISKPAMRMASSTPAHHKTHSAAQHQHSAPSAHPRLP